MVVGAFVGIRFYAGGPVHTTDGEAVGTLCVIDTEPRHFDEEQTQVLRKQDHSTGTETRHKQVCDNRKTPCQFMHDRYLLSFPSRCVVTRMYCFGKRISCSSA